MREQAAALDRLEALEAGHHAEALLVLGRDVVAVQHLDDRRQLGGRRAQARGVQREIGDVGACDEAERDQREPHGGLVAIDRRGILVLAGFEHDRDVAERADVLDQRAADVLLEPEQHGNAEREGELAVLQRVAHHEERRAAAGGRVQVEQRHALARRREQRLERAEQLALLALVGVVERGVALAQPRDVVRAPQAIQVGVVEARALREGRAVARQADELALHANAALFQRREHALERLHARRFVAVHARGDDEQRALAAVHARAPAELALDP